MKPTLLRNTLGAAAATLMLSAPSLAATDLSGTPLANTNSTQVKPNVMFILDDSGSMARAYLPDNAVNDNDKKCFRNHLFNRIYYNPANTYSPPVDATGASFGNMDFTKALSDGYDTTSTKVDLSSKYKAGNDTTGQLAYWYVYNGTKTDNSCDADAKYSAKVNPSTDAEKTNFANWYSYYRTRILAMKTAAGFAFKDIDDNYRVGFNTINYTGIDSTNDRYLALSDFDGTQKESWYKKLYSLSIDTSAYTPLRAALSKIGQLYAGKHGGGTVDKSQDPVQYSCQQNFSILSTDGYWNTNAETTTYGPDKVDGSTDVGDQDSGTTPRPMFDKLAKANTLADVAMYYYQTDLRPAGATGALGTDVSKDNVLGSGVDNAKHQHMTTFTMSFGVSGQLKYDPGYLSGDSSDYNKIVQGTLNWPAPIEDTKTAIDDLWHAAVNGRGVYYAANNAEEVASGIKDALSGIQAQKGAGAAAATSSLEPVDGNNFAYVASYRTQYWDGRLEARTINLDTGVVSDTAAWQAQVLLNDKVGASTDSRTIYKFDAAAASKLKAFTWANLNATEQGYLTSNLTSLSQYAGLTAAQKTNVTGQNLLNFIRGRTGFQDDPANADDNRVFRSRIDIDGVLDVMGDIINAQPVFVGAPAFGYADTGYTAFKTAQTGRATTVYVAANDGMLHAFDAETGEENWAYIPTAVMKNLWYLADKNYSANHHYFVDGSPVVADVYVSGAWKTILVGGLNKGGRGFYALDITDPASPTALWNYTSSDDADVGFSFGNPVITKRVSDGKWVVLLTSGYNNVSPGDGKGYLFVLDAGTGALLNKISTGEGDTANPSGFARISSWTDNGNSDNTTQYVYGGDLNGSLWRFDLSDNSVMKMASLVANNKSQPITARPELGLIKNDRIVLVGTGQLLGVTDLLTNIQQSFYAIKDTDVSQGDVRASGLLVKQTVIDNAGIRTTSTNPVDWTTMDGWYIDLPDNVGVDGKGSERVNVDPQLHFGTLLFLSNVPDANACTAGGDSWLYQLDYTSGQFVKTAIDSAAATKFVGAFGVGVNVVRLPNGKVVTITTLSDERRITGPLNEGGGTGTNAARVSWRELLDLH